MAKVHPNAAHGPLEMAVVREEDGGGAAAVLTVWQKSLLFGCSGFTVFDGQGNLAFRVDVYGGDAAAGALVLMDSSGTPLLTLRRKKLSLGETWMIFNGEDAADPVYSVKRHVSLRQGKAIAHVTPRRRGGAGGGYEIEGSYARRNCKVYDEGRRVVAEVRRKETVGGVALGEDVFRLVVELDFDACLAMAVVIVLDQMFGR
ncbi:protein LURP-one-related 8-like [Zingiber officinale]|uniref:Protein LURP-one-related 8 n=1 Tax=Zingiber officinale TaxID=94328 RepID=A0A8J5KGS7_ZINOF|nr:protein LURP-one-related 8-like [Zingiber officinale]KAG6489540.1 hypothetical protein ZIOFF_050814 [Zingiber officinale]